MTAVLLWKEYRQQRAFWLVIVGLALLLVVSLGETMGRGSGWEVFQDRQVRPILSSLVVILVMVHGLAAGALLLAGDKDDGVLVFLDSLTGRRGPLFARKVVAGVLLTLSQSLVLAGLAFGLGFGSYEMFYLPLWGLDCLVWGFLAGALCRTALTAILVGIVLLGASWPLVFTVGLSVLWLCQNLPWYLGWDPDWRDHRGNIGPVEGPLFMIALRTTVGLAAGFVAWRVYCRDDFSRQPGSWRLKDKLLSVLPADWGVLLWLVYRQGRRVLLVCVAGVVLLAFAVHPAPLIVWTFGTLFLGLACGLAAFAPDQNAGSRFLGAQRFPPGRVWTVKVLFWGAVICGLTALAWLAATLGFNSPDPGDWIGQAMRAENGPGRHAYFPVAIGNPALFLALWPLYGFCFGQFFAQALHRPIFAIVLAVFLSPLIAALWVPSLLAGGVPVWQVLIIPAILLLTSRLAQWPWVSGRLGTWRPLLGIAGAFALMALSLAGCFWYRVVQLPDVGEPFDVKAFQASLPSTQQNKAGRLIQRAAEDMVQQRDALADALRSPNEPNELMAKRREWWLNRVLTDGWSKKDDEEIGGWLDRLFQGDWAKEAQEAPKFALGMVRDPRFTDPTAGGQGDYQHYLDLARLFVIRALQLQGKGDSRGALDDLETALALSRQVANYASDRLTMDWGYRMEDIALGGLQTWLQKVGPDKELLHDAQEVLRQHRKDSPAPANSIKATYLVYLKNGPESSRVRTGIDWVLDTAYGAPWEKERQSRIVHAVVKGQLEAVKEPVVKNRNLWWDENFPDRRLFNRDQWYDMLLRWDAAINGLPPKDGPGSEISARQWGEWVRECEPIHSQIHSHLFLDLRLIVEHRRQTALDAAELVTAVARYQAEHGRPPAKLDELVPAFLAKVPMDPSTGKPFSYAISKGEEIDRGWIDPLRLAPGQAYFWSPDDYNPEFHPVPVWPKQKEDQP